MCYYYIILINIFIYLLRGCDPIIIQIGITPIGRTVNYSAYTLLENSTPANGSGTITSIEIWVTGTCTVRVGIFYISSGSDYFTCRDWVILGEVTGGAKRTFEVDLEVVEGDFIGVCTTFGNHNAGVVHTGGGGVWMKAGNYIPCTDQQFSLNSTKALDLYGEGSDVVEVEASRTGIYAFKTLK